MEKRREASGGKAGGQGKQSRKYAGKQDIEKLLAEGRTVQFPPTGWSMYPFLVNGRDMAIVAPVSEGDRFRRGEVLLYRRDGDILVLHRVWRAGGDALYFVGDNQKEVEGPLRPDQVRGRLVGFVRKGKEHSVRFLPYRIYAGLWLFLRPLRPVLSGIAAACKRALRVGRQE